MARELEYLDETLQEAEAAARWYAERSPTAAGAFAAEIDAAESDILRLPEAWPRSITERADTCFGASRSALSIESKLVAS